MRLVKCAVISGFVTVMALPGLVVANTVADSTVVDADDSVACNALAPGLTEQQLADRTGSYYELEAIELDHETNANVSKLRNLVSGRWNGTMLHESCAGHYTSPVKKQLSYRLYAAETETIHNGDIRVEAMADSADTTRIAKLFLSPEHSYSVEQLDSNTWVFTEKYRASGFPNESIPPANLALSLSGSSGRLVHEVKKVQLDQDKILVDHAVYVNGFFVSREDWVLTRS